MRSERLNCSSFHEQSRVYSPSKHCRNLHNHRDKSSIPSDVHNFKSFIAFHVFSRTFPCDHSKCCWERQLSLYLVHSYIFYSQIIPPSLFPLPFTTSRWAILFGSAQCRLRWSETFLIPYLCTCIKAEVVDCGRSGGWDLWFCSVRLKVDRMVQSWRIPRTSNRHDWGVVLSIELSSLHSPIHSTLQR